MFKQDLGPIPDIGHNIRKNSHLEDDIIYHPEPKSFTLTDQLVYSLGFGNLASPQGIMALSTSVGFVYIGGLIQARKQFIPGLLYFRNLHFNFVSGSRYMAIGFVFSLILNTANFGHFYLFEDWIRAVARLKIYKPDYIRMKLYDPYNPSLSPRPLVEPWVPVEEGLE